MFTYITSFIYLRKVPLKLLMGQTVSNRYSSTKAGSPEALTRLILVSRTVQISTALVLEYFYFKDK